MKLIDYIKQNYGTQGAFAEANGYKPNQVSVMVKKNIYYIYDGMLVIAKRTIK